MTYQDKSSPINEQLSVQQQQLQQEQMAMKEEGNNYRAELKAQNEGQAQAAQPQQQPEAEQPPLA
jgi:hypothetical protein